MASDFEIAVMQQLNDINKTCAATAATTAALKSRLFDGDASVISVLQSDIQEIKIARQRDEKWERLHNIAHYGLTPLLVAVHSIARHFGIEI